MADVAAQVKAQPSRSESLDADSQVVELHGRRLDTSATKQPAFEVIVSCKVR